MLISLIKKDFILVKRYLLFLLAFTIASPVFINNRLQLNSSGFIAFLITVVYVLFSLNSTLFVLEEKYKGSILLSTTPYTRVKQVQAKYLFMLTVFIIVFIMYTIMSLISPLGVKKLSLLSFGISLFVITTYLGMMIPLQYKFGNEKTRYISFAVIFSCPFVVPKISSWLAANNINFNITLPLSQLLQHILICILALAIGAVSMLVSIKIYSKQNL